MLFHTLLILCIIALMLVIFIIGEQNIDNRLKIQNLKQLNHKLQQELITEIDKRKSDLNYLRTQNEALLEHIKMLRSEKKD